MLDVRAFGHGDVGAIVSLWDRRVSGCFATGPLSAEAFVTDVVGKSYFDPEGLIVAFEAGRMAAFAHAAFKSSDGVNPDFRTGTITMVAVDEDALPAGEAALGQAVCYLLRRGAKQVEAFTIDFARTPFYNGLYGGEKAGMDEAHPLGMALMARCGFKVAHGAVVMRCPLAADPGPVSTPDDLELRIGPWDGPAAGRAPQACYGIPEEIRSAVLCDGAGREKVGLLFWHLERYNRAAGDRMAVISRMQAAADARGTGAPAAALRAVHRLLYRDGAGSVSLGTGGSNGRAVGFYRKLGYRPVGSAYSFFLDWRRYESYR